MESKTATGKRTGEEKNQPAGGPTTESKAGGGTTDTSVTGTAGTTGGTGASQGTTGAGATTTTRTGETAGAAAGAARGRTETEIGQAEKEGRRVYEKAKEGISTGYEKAREGISKAYTATSTQLSSAYDATMQYGRQNPGKLALITLGSGVAIGFLIARGMTRRRSNWLPALTIGVTSFIEEMLRKR